VFHEPNKETLEINMIAGRVLQRSVLISCILPFSILLLRLNPSRVLAEVKEPTSVLQPSEEKGEKHNPVLEKQKLARDEENCTLLASSVSLVRAFLSLWSCWNPKPSKTGHDRLFPDCRKAFQATTTPKQW
jgi:hypothetical protein